MNIDIKRLDEQQLLDLQSQIEKQLSKSKYPPKGTICEVWDDGDIYKRTRYSKGDGEFTSYSDSVAGVKYTNYRVVSQGLTFSDEVIKTEDITPEMDKTLCLCWDSGYDMPAIRAIDGKHKCAYTAMKGRDGAKWRNCRICTTPYELMPQWAKDIIDKLEE